MKDIKILWLQEGPTNPKQHEQEESELTRIAMKWQKIQDKAALRGKVR